MSEVPVQVDRDLDYEMNSLGRKALNLFLIPFLNSLPSNSRVFLKKTHKSAQEVIDHATTHKALEVLYGHAGARAGGNYLQNFFKAVWLSTNNSKAVRNRLKLVERELKNKLANLISEGKEIKIASIAAGSSRAVIDSIDAVKPPGDQKISVVFVDKNYEAITYSQELAQKTQYKKSFEWVHDTAGNFFRSLAENKTFNIVEMVGLIDYFNDEKAVYIFSEIYKALDKGGAFITANISDNTERPFVTKAVGWDMVYRSAEELADVLARAGFEKKKMKIFYEPLKIHCVIVASK